APRSAPLAPEPGPRLHGAARAAHPPPTPWPRSAVCRAAASFTAWPRGHVAAITGQRGVPGRFSTGSGRTRAGSGGNPIPGRVGALTLRPPALAIPRPLPGLYLGSDGRLVVGGYTMRRSADQTAGPEVRAGPPPIQAPAWQCLAHQGG